MKSKSIGSLFVVLTLVAGLIAFAPSAFADHMKVDVSIAKGASTAGCEETKSCYAPDEAIVDVGGEVTWTNTDTAAHTATSGNPTDGPDGTFDSSLFGPGKTFSHKFDEAGTFNYFCMVHPWMTGVVTVQSAEAGHPEDQTPDENVKYVTGVSRDGSTTVRVGSPLPVAGQPLNITVDFTDTAGTAIAHQNYAITAMQDGAVVLDELSAHQHGGHGEHATDKLSSDSPVDVQVTLLGVGLPGSEDSWTGPKGDVIKLQVVPEFGTITALVLAISIVSIIAVTAKTRVIPKL
ncbi:MAG TPA: PEFG-CTERM sorting domain-containing protein [Nitrosopumilaceae archaeon]|nr:PEFG-CTERM sorting domain-containing protein [Nitrosopumilaceae archaeon]